MKPSCAIILAAGRGRRLGVLTRTRPKCLLRVGARTLLEHQLAALALVGIERVAVVIGFAGEQVRQVGGAGLHYILNNRSTVTNSLYSLWLARDLARNGFLLLNADVLFHPELLVRLLHSPYPDALTVERRERFDAEEMKVTLAGDRVLALSKQLDAQRAHAENVGIVKFSPAGAEALFATMERLLARGAERELSPFAFHALAQHYPLHAVLINGIPWIEIDFVADLRRARREILPALTAHAWTPPTPVASPPAALKTPGRPVAGVES
ncbi:MAG: NTP transferase domain-containing protein [Terriglobia bacterium]